MAYFLVEIPMNDAGPLELERAARTLGAAQARLRGSAATHTIIAGINRYAGGLIYLIEASSPDAVQRLVSMALLPAGRIREITHITAGPSRPSRPG